MGGGARASVAVMTAFVLVRAMGAAQVAHAEEKIEEEAEERKERDE